MSPTEESVKQLAVGIVVHEEFWVVFLGEGVTGLCCQVDTSILLLLRLPSSDVNHLFVVIIVVFSLY